MQELTIKTKAQVEMVDITTRVEEILKQEGKKEGICYVFVPHTTAGITINENADSDVVKDMIMELNKIVPLQDNYLHLEGNSAAHIKASLMGFSQNLIVHQGKIVLGTWQGIYFCEFDGPRTRKVFLKFL